MGAVARRNRRIVLVNAQGINMNSAHIFCLTIASLACVTDLNTRRIPNGLTFGAALVGFLYQFLSGGLDGLGHAALGWLVGAVIFILPFALGGLGGGDVKLLAALGAWLGPGGRCLAGALHRRRRRSHGACRVGDLRISRDRPPERLFAPLSLARRRDRNGAVDHARAQQGPQAGLRVSDLDGDGGNDMAAMNLYRRLACDKGAELVEFALVLPLLLLVMFGIMDFGLLFQRYEAVTNAAREGARIAVLPGYAQADVEARVNQYLAAAGLKSTPTIRLYRPTGAECRWRLRDHHRRDGRLPTSVFVHWKDRRTIRRLWIHHENADRHREDAVRRRGIDVLVTTAHQETA